MITSIPQSEIDEVLADNSPLPWTDEWKAAAERWFEVEGRALGPHDKIRYLHLMGMCLLSNNARELNEFFKDVFEEFLEITEPCA